MTVLIDFYFNFVKALLIFKHVIFVFIVLLSLLRFQSHSAGKKVTRALIKGFTRYNGLLQINIIIIIINIIYHLTL